MSNIQHIRHQHHVVIVSDEFHDPPAMNTRSATKRREKEDVDKQRLLTKGSETSTNYNNIVANEDVQIVTDANEEEFDEMPSDEDFLLFINGISAFVDFSEMFGVNLDMMLANPQEMFTDWVLQTREQRQREVELASLHNVDMEEFFEEW
jgi:hypothetical protein